MFFWVFQQGYASEAWSSSENVDWPGFHDGNPWQMSDCPARADHTVFPDDWSTQDFWRTMSPWDEQPLL